MPVLILVVELERVMEQADWVEEFVGAEAGDLQSHLPEDPSVSSQVGLALD